MKVLNAIGDFICLCLVLGSFAVTFLVAVLTALLPAALCGAAIVYLWRAL